MKKRVIIEIIGAILIFIVGYFAGDTVAINRMNKTVDSKVSSETSDTSTSSKPTKPKEEQKQKIYKLGEEGTSGNWGIKVLDVQELTTIQGGDSSDNRTTQQKFIMVKLQLNNKSQAAAQYSNEEFILDDTKTKAQYKSSMEAGETANQKETIYNKNSEFVGINEDVNPNTPKQTYVVFEVPKDFNMENGILIHGDNDGKAVGYNIK